MDMGFPNEIVECEQLGKDLYSIHFSDGSRITVDTAVRPHSGSGLEDQDEEALARTTIIRNYGKVLRWPGGVEFCTNALLVRALELNQDD